jgi:TolB-like protein
MLLEAKLRILWLFLGDLIRWRMLFRFKGFELNTARGELRAGDEEVLLEPRAFSLLCLLVENSDRVITKDEAIEKVWSGRFVSDSAISTALKSVRRALGDDGETQGMVRTVRGRGFRFVEPVTLRGVAPAEAATTLKEPETSRDSGRPSLAVPPFRFVGQSEGHTAIADAIPAELIASLSRLRWLKVFARGSTFRFRDHDADLAAVGSTLGAHYCISGIVEIFGPHLAVSVELTDVRTMSVVWGERFQGRLDDVHNIRSEIVASVVSALELHVPMQEAEAARLRPPQSLDAWALYHVGLRHMYRFNKADNVAAAAWFDKAIQQDPDFSRAYAARSFTSFQCAFLNYTRNRDADVQDARQFAERSVELDPLDPMGCFNLARAHWLEGAPETGLGWLDRTINLSPNYAQGHYARGWTDAIAGRGSDALRHIGTAIDLSPLDPFLYAMQATRALAYLGDGDTKRAAIWSEHAARAPGAHYLIALIAAASHQMDGGHEQAVFWSNHALRRRPGASVERFFRAFPFADQEFRREITAALRKSGVSN